MKEAKQIPSAAKEPPNAHLAAIVELAEDAIISKTLEGIITSWNAGARKTFGYTAEEMVGRPISILVPPELGEQEPEILARIRRGERLERFATKRIRKDGKRIDVLLTISPIFDEHGKVVGACKFARDITSDKAAERQLRLDRERLEVTLSSIGDAVIVTNERGVVQFLNPIAESLTGWKQEEAKGQTLEAVFAIINETTRQRVESPALRAMSEGKPVPLANHTILVSRSGSELAIDDSAAPIRDPAGKVSGVIMVFRDVTANRAVEEARARLSAIVEGSDDAIIGKDLEGRITSWNKGAERILGYSQEEALGRPITMLIPPERLGEESEILRRLRRGEKVDHFETVRVTRDQRTVDVSVTISPVRDAEGRVVGASKIARDITEKKRAERELAEAHRRLQGHAQELEEQVAARTAELKASLDELETFSAGLSHDLKSPLRGISMRVETIRDEYGQKMPPDVLASLEQIQKICGKLGRFVDNVLSYARLSRAQLRLERVELDQLIPRVIEQYPHVAQANAEVEVCHPLLPVQAHEGLLTQVLANFVSNGVKFVAPGTRPKLRIGTEETDSRVRLWIQDNGIGIPESEQEKVFGLFTRGRDAHRYEGCGVGLAVVLRAVRRMGGETGLESEPGQGSRFWVELPKA